MIETIVLYGTVYLPRGTKVFGTLPTLPENVKFLDMDLFFLALGILTSLTDCSKDRQNNLPGYIKTVKIFKILTGQELKTAKDMVDLARNYMEWDPISAKSLVEQKGRGLLAGKLGAA